MALNSRLDPWIGDQRRRIIQARSEAQPIIGKPICHDPIDETPEEKLARQKRREAIGQRYLAGRGAPFIMSAQLKGPFDRSSGWKNPWLPEEPEEEAASKEIIRPLPLQKLTGRPRNGSVASVRSVISIGSNSQSLVGGDRLNSLRQTVAAAKPNLHGGLKQFLGATAGSAPSSSRKLDNSIRKSDNRDSIQKLPILKRKADTSWLKGADIVKKKRKELPDLPSPTPPSRPGQDARPIVTPTNLLGKFKQHSQSQFSQYSPSTQTSAVRSGQGNGFPDLSIDSQGHPRTALLRSKLNQTIARRSTSDASALTATYEEPIRPLAARVRSLNEREVVGNGSFQFRKTKSVPDYVSEGVMSSIERDEDDENDENESTIVPDEEEKTHPDVAIVVTQPSKKPVQVRTSTTASATFYKPIANAPEPNDQSHQEVLAPLTAEEIRDKQGRIRNSQSLPSDSDSGTESRENSRVPAQKEHKIRHTYVSRPTTKQDVLPAQDETGEVLVSSTVEEPSRIAESQSQARGHYMSTVQEVTGRTATHVEGSLPTVEASTNATKNLVMDVLQDEMLSADEPDTSMPDIPDSTPVAEHTAVEEKQVEEADSQDVTENTYVQMAMSSFSTSTGSEPNNIHRTQSTAMNTQAIESLKANFLQESDDDKDIMPAAPRRSSSARTAIQEKTSMEEETVSDLSQSILRSAARPQIGTSEPTNTASSRPGTATTQPNSQGAIASQAQNWVQLGTVAKAEQSSSRPQNAQRREGKPHGSDEKGASGTIGTDSQPVIARIRRERYHIASSEPANTGATVNSQPAPVSAGLSPSSQPIDFVATADPSTQSRKAQRQEDRPLISSTEHTQSATTASISHAATASAGQSSMQQSIALDATDSSSGSPYAQRRERPQISSTDVTQSGTTESVSEIAITSMALGSTRQGSGAVSPGSTNESQNLQRQQTLPRISDSEPTASSTTTPASQIATTCAAQSSTQLARATEPTVDDILRILRSSQRRGSSQGERTPTQASQNRALLGGDTIMAEEQTFSQMLASTKEEQPPSSPSHSQLYSHTASQYKSFQLDAQVQLDFQSSQPQSYIHATNYAHGVQEENTSTSTNTGTTTTEFFLLQAIAQDMARPDEGGISHTGLIESSHENNFAGCESTPKHSLSQRRMEEVQLEKSSHDLPVHSNGPVLAPETLQEPETQSWHISTIDDETMMDVSSSSTHSPLPHQPTDGVVVDSKPTSSPPPSVVPASIEEALPTQQPTLSLSDNPWAIATQQSPTKGYPRSSSKKRVAFNDAPTSFSVDDDDLDRPAPVTIQPSSPQQSTANLPSSPPVRMVSVPPAQQQIPIFSPPPVYHEPPSTESPFPIIINGVRNRAPQLPASSQGIGGMANAFLNADRLAPIREPAREDTLSPPKMLPPAPARDREHTLEPMEGAEEVKSKLGQSSVARQLAAMYPSSSEDEDYSDVESPSGARQIRSRSRQILPDESPKFASQEPFQHRGMERMGRERGGPRVQVSRSPSTITDPYANPWATQQPAPSAPAPEEEDSEDDYDEMPPFAMGNILGMLGDEFGSSRAAPDEGVGQVADEMSDLLETWDVDEELTKQRRESGRDVGKKRSSARERVGWGRI